MLIFQYFYFVLINITLADWNLGFFKNLFEIGNQKDANCQAVKQPKLNYGIIIDAGSTQTRLYVYEWKGPSNATDSPYINPMIKHGYQVRFVKDGGLNDIPIKEISTYMEDLIDSALGVIPAESQDETPLFLLATGGIRVLVPAIAEEITANLKDYLSKKVNSPFKFDPDFGVQVIPGEFEGAFDWLAVNYVFGSLHKHSPKDTVISLDMGGASVELTFEPSNRIKDGAFPLRVNGTDRILYTKSFLKFGRNQALIRHRVNLVNEALDNDPDLKRKCAKCKALEVTDPCFPLGYVKRMYKPHFKRQIRFLGTGDYSLCNIYTKKLLKLTQYCPAEPCSINGAYQPSVPEDRPIFALDAFAKTAEYFKCSPVSTSNCIDRKAQEFCQDSRIQQFENGKTHYPHNLHPLKQQHLSASSVVVDPITGQNDSFEYNRCFLASYIVNMLQNGFKIDPMREIHFGDFYNGTSIGYTLGAMIYELERYSFTHGVCPDQPPEGLLRNQYCL